MNESLFAKLPPRKTNLGDQQHGREQIKGRLRPMASGMLPVGVLLFFLNAILRANC
jgi:hypothetical protein